VGAAYDIVVAGVITVILSVVHLMAVELFAPGSPLFALATDGTGVLNGTARANLWFQILAVWGPLAVFIGIWLWVGIRKWKRTVQTATRPT
jgi:hypothetical protein